MSTNNLQRLSDEADLAWRRDELALAWYAANFEASAAYRAWSASPGATTLEYLAMLERATTFRSSVGVSAVKTLLRGKPGIQRHRGRRYDASREPSHHKAGE
jgi:hypothetical protein